MRFQLVSLWLIECIHNDVLWVRSTVRCPVCVCLCVSLHKVFDCAMGCVFHHLLLSYDCAACFRPFLLFNNLKGFSPETLRMAAVSFQDKPQQAALSKPIFNFYSWGVRMVNYEVKRSSCLCLWSDLNNSHALWNPPTFDVQVVMQKKKENKCKAPSKKTWAIFFLNNIPFKGLD